MLYQQTSYLLACLMSLLLFISCGSSSQNSTYKTGVNKTLSFDGYWYNSKAEITTYKLQQARYGEVHEGTSSMIFVTEPFNTFKQVKSDNGMAKDAVSVLKLNQTRKFTTGIYPYSTMTSSFTPVSDPQRTIKVTTSVQEWCGQVFTQLNRYNDKFKIKTFSYFESEGDTEKTIASALLEDEIPSLIRINPELLPTGTIKCIPSLIHHRFLHTEIQSHNATAELYEADFEGTPSMSYQINYSDLDRRITMYYKNEFPFEILGWEEVHKNQATKAIRKNVMLIDYWNHNKLVDSTLYKKLFDF